MSAYFAHAPRWLRSAVALAVFLSLTATGAAQTETGRITGVVTDATEHPARRYREREGGQDRRDAHRGHRLRGPVRLRQPAAGPMRVD